LSGTPEEADVGTYSNIIIGVTDANTRATLVPYSILVAQAPSGTVSLSWVPPVQNTDGTAITDLAGYHIYYGRDSTSMDQVVTIRNPRAASYELANLSAGDWFFTIVAYTSDNVTSSASGLISASL
jgi:hypothetical protein